MEITSNAEHLFMGVLVVHVYEHWKGSIIYVFDDSMITHIENPKASPQNITRTNK